MELYKIKQKLFLFPEIVLNDMEELIISSLKEVRISVDKDFIWLPFVCTSTACSFKLLFPASSLMVD